jgi:hypothetical protein
MQTNTEELPLASAIKRFFFDGKIENADLMKEYKKLTPLDREEIKAGLEKLGFKIKPLIGSTLS